MLASPLPDLHFSLCQFVSELPASRQSAICVIMHGPIFGEESLRVLLNVFITMLCVERTISLSYLRASTWNPKSGDYSAWSYLISIILHGVTWVATSHLTASLYMKTFSWSLSHFMLRAFNVVLCVSSILRICLFETKVLNVYITRFILESLYEVHNSLFSNFILWPCLLINLL